MAKKDKRPKKVSAKKEKYAKFHREKPGTLDIAFPDLTDEQVDQKKTDEEKMDKYLRFNRNIPSKEINDRRAKSKRAKIKG